VNDKKLTVLCVITFCLLILICSGCNSKDSYVGRYQAIDNAGEIAGDNLIELMENGQGAWTCCDSEVLFTWYVKARELRIHTKEGGVMVGQLEKESFTLILPGKKKFLFTRIFSEE